MTGAFQTREIDTPLGLMLAGAADDGVCLLEFTDRRALPAELRELDRRLGQRSERERRELLRDIGGFEVPSPDDHLDRLSDELSAYFGGMVTRFTVPLVSVGSPFERAVWDELARIPYGRTTSYGSIARRLSQPGAARAVGRANGRNRIAIVIPCHRVIDSSGHLHGYGGGLWRKRYLLELEMSVAGHETGSLWPPALAGSGAGGSSL
jgi:AraC family transcriptional regulator, regulatory protein of adaptative response / methylated-DNA-[protein]-cysteine methyltransferase